MKFTILWKDTVDSRNSIAEWLTSGESWDGVKLSRADDGFTMLSLSGSTLGTAHALRCTGSFASYLACKREAGSSVWLGWGDPV